MSVAFVHWQLCKGSEVANSAAKIFELLVQFLCVDHIDYAVELGLQGENLSVSP